ncbi:hypothetical protein SAMN05443144_10773 [Fodinibius roseus]|uniref:Uncharacterized protein n=1 Tax=Fodinibius roseus TaxID=1194090 RepID=A0A1M5AIU0_9BACT|nr:hypothetical protein [Fodinibius roseus]SHF29822.1 hypothetical protein SAMN05443144_10773 [Fodinibius roseus]
MDIKRLRLMLPLLAGAGLLFIPLAGDFHIESAILASLAGCFWAGLRACGHSRQKSDFYSALTVAGYLYVGGLPLAVNALAGGCFSVHGLAFWLIYPLPSVFFGYAVGRLARKWGLWYRRTATTVILLIIGVGVLLVEFFNYPQLYFFNHVWGGWAGPIYDEAITVSGAAFFFRSMTGLWALLLWHIPSAGSDRLAVWIVGISAVGLGVGYTQLAETGIISPPSYIQAVLGGSLETEHFQLYYDREYYSDYEIRMLAREHEFYLERISDKLKLNPADFSHKIESYLYAHPWQKKRLVGAKFTSFVPVWLARDQLHIAKQQITGSLKHELVHVAAKQFGNALLNASWSIGLVEGLAVAVDGGSSPTTTVDQMVAAEKPYPGPEALRQALSPWGFYSGRSGVNYMTGGSFVQYLLDRYPAEHIKEAYRTGDVGDAYPQDWQLLVGGWHRHLDSVAVDSTDRRNARQLFSIPSLLEQRCPHVVSAFASAWDNYRYYRAAGDTAEALVALDRALVESDSLPSIQAEWSYRHLEAGEPGAVRRVASLKDTTLDLQLLYADAFALIGNREQARAHVEQARTIYASGPDTLRKEALDTRTGNRQWQIYRRLTYGRELPDSATFDKALYRTKIRAVRASVEQEEWASMMGYAEQLLEHPLRDDFFDDYLALIHHLCFQREDEAALEWIRKLSRTGLRDRHRQRLNREIDWHYFLKNRENFEKP